jgi:hypothetical protein
VKLSQVLVIVLGVLVLIQLMPKQTPTPTPQPEQKPDPKPEPKPEPKPDAWNAIGRIQFGNAGCTATIVGPRRTDGRWDVLSANHCFERTPTTGTMRLRDGTEFSIKLVNKNKQADCAWLVTDRADLDTLPFALLADKLPAIGDKIFHGGFGVDVPGNKETGVVVDPDNGAQQTQFNLNVSSGDSGGGMCLDSMGRLVSCVCCTTAKGRYADVWGATLTEIRNLRGKVSNEWQEWKPIEIPVRMPGKRETKEEKPEPKKATVEPVEMPTPPSPVTMTPTAAPITYQAQPQIFYQPYPTYFAPAPAASCGPGGCVRPNWR